MKWIDATRNYLTGIVDDSPLLQIARQGIFNVEFYLRYAKGDLQGALASMTQAVDLALEMADERWILATKSNRAGVLKLLGRLQEASEVQCEILEVYRRRGETTMVGMSLSNISEVYLMAGDISRSKKTIIEAQTYLRQSAPAAWLSKGLSILGICLRKEGNFAESRCAFEESFTLIKDLPHQESTAQILEEIARLNLLTGHPEQAIFLFAAADSIRSRISVTVVAPSKEEIALAFDSCIESKGIEVASEWQKRGNMASGAEIATIVLGDGTHSIPGCGTLR